MSAFWDNLSESVAEVLAIAQAETKDFGVQEIGNLTIFLGILGEAKSLAGC